MIDRLNKLTTGRRMWEANMERKGSILIIDDEEGVTDLLKDFFIEYGYESDIAHDGIEAQKLWEDGGHKLILTDIIFSRVGGIDLIRAIRQKDRTIPIVAMTGFGAKAAMDAIEAGANDFLLKPFSMSQIRAKIGKFIDL
jgi:DNA-binding response OmpR family regulator